eukprot:TRINITY_DN62244_c0_g1_i1.p1 TRINITY_DN62244_c0_g1~~TRINITY_DN62244_c0_g1_i1.p1  ORF type:complete len:115 (+),score=9.70 TRINITY_DN62244_c0_g1_i1:47-391(+)
MTEIVYVKNKDEFKEKVLEKSKTSPVILDFYADWCPPCRKLGETLTEKVKSSNGWTVVKVNVDDEDVGEIAEDHEVQGIPAVFYYEGGEKKDNFVGFNAAKLDEFINKAASAGK